MKAMLLLAGLILLVGCGSGVTDSFGDGDRTVEAERERRYQDEAIFRALDLTTETCDQIDCPFADSDAIGTQTPGGRLTRSCTYECVDSEIDTSGEVRQYFVFLAWTRRPGECWQPDDLTSAQRYSSPCVPRS